MTFPNHKNIKISPRHRFYQNSNDNKAKKTTVRAIVSVFILRAYRWCT